VGQKTHPKGFRLVTTQKHSSEWYSSKQNYPQLIEEDFFIRQKVEEIFNEFLTISNIEINRVDQHLENKESVNITIYALFPRAKEMYRKIAKYFIETTENPSPKVVSILNSPKNNLKKFTTILLKRNIRNLIRLFQIKLKKYNVRNYRVSKFKFQDA
jgi:3-methyladenine DNA glycosylase AlkC